MDHGSDGVNELMRRASDFETALTHVQECAEAMINAMAPATRSLYERNVRLRRYVRTLEADLVDEMTSPTRHEPMDFSLVDYRRASLIGSEDLEDVDL